jgi:hypothetical protein
LEAILRWTRNKQERCRDYTNIHFYTLVRMWHFSPNAIKLSMSLSNCSPVMRDYKMSQQSKIAVKVGGRKTDQSTSPIFSGRFCQNRRNFLSSDFLLNFLEICFLCHEGLIIKTVLGLSCRAPQSRSKTWARFLSSPAGQVQNKTTCPGNLSR